MSTLPEKGYAPLPASTDPAFLSWISKDGPGGGAKYQQPALRGPNWMGGTVVCPSST